MGNAIHAHIIKVVTVVEDGTADSPLNRSMEAALSPELRKNTEDLGSGLPIPITAIDTTIMIGGSAEVGKTVLTKGIPEKLAASITRLKTGETYQIDSSVYKIGRLGSFVNLCLPDNPAIGRIHAQIEYDDGQYFLVDKRSLNRTYLKGDQEPMVACRRYPINSGDSFKLFDDEFIFKMELY